MNRAEIFAVLQIEPTNNTMEIKKAYAELTKKYHPEEYPDEWQKIHAAYGQALSYAQNDSQQPLLNEQQWNQVWQPYYTSQENSTTIANMEQSAETDEINEVFEDIDKLADEQKNEINKQQEEQFIIAVKRLKELDKCRDYEKWQRLFADTDIRILSKGDFLYRWGDMLAEMSITPEMKDLFLRQMDEIRSYCAQNNIKHARTRSLDPILFMQKTLREKEARKFGGNGKPAGWIAGAVSAVFILQMLGVKMEEAVEKKNQQQQVVIDSLNNLGEQDWLDDSNRYSVSSLYDSNLETLQMDLASIQQEAVTEETAGQSMIENAATLRDGVLLFKESSDFKKNTSEYRYDVITDAEKISALLGVTVEEGQFYALKLWTVDDAHAAAFAFQAKKLGMEEECSVFCIVDGRLEEIPEYDYEATQPQTNCVYEFGGYKSVALEIPQGDADAGIVVILVNESVQ